MDIFHYALRLTPYPNTEYNIQQCRTLIPKFIKEIGGIDYLFGQEFEKNGHFHIVFSHSEEFNPDPKVDKKAQEIRDILYSIFEVPKSKRGNPSYSMEVIRDLAHALSYAVKDGNFDSSEQWKQVATEASENSFLKKYSVKSSIADLSDKFIKGDINEVQLWTQLGQSRADLGLPLSIKWIDEMVLSIKCKKDPELLRDIWEDRETRKKY